VVSPGQRIIADYEDGIISTEAVNP